MASEVKSAHKLRAEERERSARADLSTSVCIPVDPTRARAWFDAIDPAARRAPQRTPVERWLAAPLFVVALVLVAVARSVLVRVLLPLALAVAAVAILARQRGAQRPVPRRDVRGLWLEADHVAFVVGDAAPQPLVYTDTPFGVTLVTNVTRTALVAVLTSGAGTFSIGASVEPSDDPTVTAAIHRLLDGASISADGLGLESIGPDGAPLVLAPDAFASLVDGLSARSPACLHRFVLTDTRGAPLTLDDGALEVGDRRIDLNAPLEWRSITFHEAFGQSYAFYQGTWIRQGAAELVLVSLLPAGSGPLLRDADLGSLERPILRDLRLMQATAEQPPPQEQRVAIERLFMLPLRAALDRAPRASAPETRAQA